MIELSKCDRVIVIELSKRDRVIENRVMNRDRVIEIVINVIEYRKCERFIVTS